MVGTEEITIALGFVFSAGLNISRSPCEAPKHNCTWNIMRSEGSSRWNICGGARNTILIGVNILMNPLHGPANIIGMNQNDNDVSGCANRNHEKSWTTHLNVSRKKNIKKILAVAVFISKLSQ